MIKFAIIGAGNAGCAFAAHLKLLGHETRLYDVFEKQLSGLVQADNVIEFGGNLDVSGVGPGATAPARIDYVGNDLATAVENADVIMCTAPAHAHRAMAIDLAAHVTAGQVIVLNPGRTCGAIEVARVLAENGAAQDVTVVEAQTLLYACRRTGNSVHVFGVKERVGCAALPHDQLDRFLQPMQSALPQFVKEQQGIWATSLDNIGMLFHPTPTLFNLSRMETGEPFDYYIDGMSPTLAALVEKLDGERCQIAQAMGVEIPNAVQWLKLTYGAEGNSLYEAVQNNPAYVGIKAPQLKSVEDKLGLRYVVEDVPTGLVPVSELGAKLGIATPNIDLMIRVAEMVYDRDFRADGRTLQRLGLAGLSNEQLKAL